MARVTGYNSIPAARYLGSKSLKQAIESTLKRMRYLFGDDIPDALVRTAVSLTYAEHVKKKKKKWRDHAVSRFDLAKLNAKRIKGKG